MKEGIRGNEGRGDREEERRRGKEGMMEGGQGEETRREKE